MEQPTVDGDASPELPEGSATSSVLTTEDMEGVEEWAGADKDLEEDDASEEEEDNQSENAIRSFGERLGVTDVDVSHVQREDSSSDSGGSKRSLDNLSDVEDDNTGPQRRRLNLNNDFMSTMGRENSPVRQEREEHYRYAELSGQEINVMKLDLLYKISVLNEAGFESPKTFSIDDSLVALEAEHGRLTNLEDLQYGMQMARYVLTNGVSLIESVNENFRLSPLKLKGWSVAVHRDVNKYNPILLELYQQHAYAVRLSPLTKLCIALCFSAASTHLANSMRSNEGDAPDAGNMFGSVLNMFGAGARQNRTPVRAPGASAPPDRTPPGDATGQQPTMQGPPPVL